MLHIIHAKNKNRILDYAKRKNAGYPFIWAGSQVDSDREILSSYGLKELNLYEPQDKEKIDNEQEYISTISKLGPVYDSIAWWANGVSEKNEHLSNHYKNIVWFYCLINTLKRHANAERNIFVIASDEIFSQLKDYCHKNCIKISSLEPLIITRIKELLLRARFYLSVLMLYIRAILKKLYLDYALGKVIKKEINKDIKHYIIMTRLDGYFLAKEGYLQDTLFGNLPAYALERGYNVLILARIPEDHYLAVVKKIKDIKNFLIIPEDYFLGYLDLLRLWKYLCFKKKRFINNIVFSGLDVTRIYEQEIDNGYLSTDYLRNILTYFMAKNIAKRLNFKIYVQAFENYAWEKLNIMGIKKNKPDCRIFGFQHAFISRNSFKYFHGAGDSILLPDKIITMGSNTRIILERYGNYGKLILTTGCALRQEYIAGIKPFKRRNLRRILVPLTMARDESVLILRFLYDSGLPETKNKVIIRPHPALPFEKFKKDTRFKIPDNFIIDNEKPVKEELAETDIVFYTWSTVAVEALKSGLFVVYLDILEPMYVDPLFECNALKRTVAKKEELVSVIEDIYAMPDEVFYREQQMAQEYLKGYFYPVNNDTLTPFFE